MCPLKREQSHASELRHAKLTLDSIEGIGRKSRSWIKAQAVWQYHVIIGKASVITVSNHRFKIMENCGTSGLQYRWHTDAFKCTGFYVHLDVFQERPIHTSPRLESVVAHFLILVISKLCLLCTQSLLHWQQTWTIFVMWPNSVWPISQSTCNISKQYIYSNLHFI